MQLKRIVVTGMGCLTPLGNSTTEYWNNLRNGVSGCDFITLFDASKFKTRFACEIKTSTPRRTSIKKKRASWTALRKPRW
jgi:3-oxoacyl-[acyl-carrier-protein] synthase II